MIMLLIFSILIALSIFYEVDSGIAGLTKYFRDFHRTAWISTSKRKSNSLNYERPQAADHVCIDMNQVLHTSCRCADDPKHIMARIFTNLDDLLRVINPRKSLCLAFDGPAPFAKMQTQRSRRKTSPDSCLITPGTDFMNGMENLMLCYTLQRIQKTTFQNVSIFISGPETPGEGELKIIDWIFRNKPPLNETIVICGCDSDIILQALTLGTDYNCMVLQSGTEFSDAFCNISLLHKSMSSSIFSQANTTLFEESLNKYSTAVGLIHQNDSKVHKFEDFIAEFGNSTTSRFEIILLFILQGNDYLPKLRGVTIPKVLRTYAETIRRQPPGRRFLYDINNGTFNFQALYMFCNGLGNAGGVALPVQAPGVVQCLHNLMQKLKYTFNWTDIANSTADESGRIFNHWGGQLEFADKVYTAPGVYGSKRDVRKALATRALLDIDRDLYDQMLSRQANARAELEAIRESVKNDNASGFSAYTVVNDSAAAVDENVGTGTGEMPIIEDEDEYSVSDDEYLSYLKFDDVEHYLRGLLWVLKMYRVGSCPDLSYSYNGRPIVTPYSICRYLDIMFREFGVEELEKRIRLPDSTHRALSADAAVCCVIPGSGEEFVPKRLRGPWAFLQKTFFDTMSKDSLVSTTYADLVEGLRVAWNNSEVSVSLRGSFELNQRQNQRRQSRKQRKVNGVAKQIKRLNFTDISAQSGLRKQYEVSGVFNDNRDWLVITRLNNLHERGYGGAFERVSLELPLALPFQTPSRLPVDVEVMRTMDTPSLGISIKGPRPSFTSVNATKESRQKSPYREAKPQADSTKAKKRKMRQKLKRGLSKGDDSPSAAVEGTTSSSPVIGA